MNEPLKATTLAQAVKIASNSVTLTKYSSEDATKHSKDAIVAPEDVIQHSEDARDVREEEQGINERDCTKMVVSPENKTPDTWHENYLLPTQPHLLRTLEQEERFLGVLREKKYIVWAAPEFGCSHMTVNRRMLENPEFASAVHQVIAHREEMMLAQIEAVSESEAVKEGRNTDRAMQLNALGYGKYKRDTKGLQVATQVNIMIGFTPPKHRGT